MRPVAAAALLPDYEPSAEPSGPAVRSLAQLLADPEILKPPAAVVPRLAWRGRVTLLAAREKDGKSTLGAAGAAALTQGRPFLGEPVAPGSVLWLLLEEHAGDFARRAQRFDTHPDRLFIVGPHDADPIDALDRVAQELRPALCVVDTLAALVDGLVADSRSATDWTPSLRRLTAIARSTDTALLLFGHSRKSDGAYRDSSAIGANVDAILEMSVPVDDASARVVKARGRWDLSPFTVRLSGDTYSLGGGEMSLDARVLSRIASEPNISQKGLRELIGGRAKAVDEAVRALLDRGAIADVGGAEGHRYVVKRDDPRDDPSSGGKSLGDKDGTTFGTTPRPDSKPLDTDRDDPSDTQARHALAEGA